MKGGFISRQLGKGVVRLAIAYESLSQSSDLGLQIAGLLALLLQSLFVQFQIQGLRPFVHRPTIVDRARYSNLFSCPLLRAFLQNPILPVGEDAGLHHRDTAESPNQPDDLFD